MPKKLTCLHCQQEKKPQQFAARAGTSHHGKQYWCRECMAKNAKDRRIRRALGAEGLAVAL